MNEPRIVVMPAKKLVGFGAEMSLAQDATAQLWRKLMPRRRELSNRVTSDYISMRVHGKTGMSLEEMFSPTTVFEKWAAVEVADFDAVPDGMACHVLTGGTYAVFVHSGPASTFPKTMQHIFDDWLPASEYELDDREQFEVIPQGWDPLDEQAREQVWIPVKRRAPT